jgi:cyclase
MKQITPNVYTETDFTGCNPSFVTTSEGIVLIDTPWSPTDALQWQSEVAKKGEIRYTINTDHNIDHTTGNYFFTAPIVAHQGTREELLRAPLDTILHRTKDIDPEGFYLLSGYSLRLPAITFSSRANLYVGEHSFQLIHLVGHTANTIAVYVPEEKVLFCGDNVFFKRQPVMRESYPEQWIESLADLEKLNADIIVPGHGDVCEDRDYLRELASFLGEWVDAVRRAIGRGMSKEDCADAISFLDRYPMNPGRETFGPELQRENAKRVYDVLTKRLRI